MTRDDARRRTLILAAALYGAMLLFLSVGLGFDMMQSDAATYWKESFKWRTPYSTWWVPGHPIMLAVTRGITLGLLPAIAVMVAIAAASYGIAVATMYRLAETVRAPRPALLTLVFACFPFVGLTYSVYPIADSPSTAVFVLAVLALVRRSWGAFVVCSAAALMIHKVMWFFIPPLLIYAFLQHPESRTRLPLAVLPLAVWVMAGAFYHHDALWFVRWGINHLVAPRGDIPLLDGLIDPFRSGSPPKIAKGIAVLGLLGVTIATGILAWRRGQWIALCIAGSLGTLILTINSYEIWVTMRFGKLLLLPLAMVLGARPERSSEAARGEATEPGVPAWGWLTLVCLLASNLAYGWYMARYFTFD